MEPRATWSRALARKDVWRRALKIGIPIGVLQATIHQGDSWATHAVDRAVLAKTIISPAVTILAALLSAAGAQIERTRRRDGKN